MPELNREDDIRRLEHNLAELRTLVRIVDQINQSLDLQQVLRTSLSEIEHMLAGAWGCFLLLDPSARTLELSSTRELASPLYEALQRLARDPQVLAALDESGGQARALSQLRDNVYAELERKSIQPPELIPLISRGQPIGLLLVAAQSPMPLSAEGRGFLGEQVGRAIEQARRHVMLRQSEEWHRLFIENSPDGFVEVDSENRITFVNDAACQMLGYGRAEFLTMRGSDFLVNSEGAQQASQELARTGIMGDHLVRARVKSGAIKTLSVTTRLVRRAQDHVVGYQSILRDVTEQQQWLETLHRRNQELNTLNAIADILSHPLELAPALDQICEQVASITGMECAAICLNEESNHVMRLVAQCGLPAPLLEQARTVGLDDPAAFHIAVQGESIALDDVALYPSPALAGPRAVGIHAGIGVPIKQGGTPVGAIFVGSRTRVHYEPSDVALLLNIGQRIGMALENADLYAHMQRRVDDLDGLAQLSAACASSLDPQAISQLAVQSTRQLLHVEMSSLHLISRGSLRLDASTASPEEVEQRPFHAASLSVLQEHGVWAIDDVEKENEARQALAPCFEATNLRSVLIAPLPGRDGLLGILAAGYAQPHRWSPPEKDLLQTIANQIASGLANAQLFQKVLSEQRKVQALFDSGLSGLFATDAAGRIEMFNRAAERITGWTMRDVQGKKWEEVFADANDGESVEPLINVALKNNQTAYVPDGRRILTRDGRIIPVAKAVAPLVDENGHVAGAVGAFWDLSREKAAELSRENFLRMAAHQIRNPLTALIVALELADNPRLSKERREEIRALIKSQAERLRKISQEFLDVEEPARLARPVRCAALPIADIVRRLVQESQMTNPHHRFRLHICEPEPLAYADGDRVENILHNLLDNAVNYSSVKSTVQVSVEVRSQENQVDIAVQDQGPGIPFAEQEHVFDMFYRGQGTFERRAYGHGLGLYIARKLAQEMDGTIELSSTEGGGCTFHLILRRCQ
jgi:PAS domain S-box-containing protein